MGGGGGAHACVCAGGSHHSSTFNEHGKQSNNPTSLQWATHVWRRIASSVLLVVTPRAPVCRDDHDLHGLRLVHGGADPAPACNVGGEPVLVLSAVAVPRVEELVDVGLVWDAGEVDGRRVVAVVVDRTQPASRALAVAPAVKLVLRARVRRERYVPVRGGGRRARSRGRRRSRRERTNKQEKVRRGWSSARVWEGLNARRSHPCLRGRHARTTNHAVGRLPTVYAVRSREPRRTVGAKRTGSARNKLPRPLTCSLLRRCCTAGKSCRPADSSDPRLARRRGRSSWKRGPRKRPGW